MPQQWLSEQQAMDYLASRNEGRLATCDEQAQPYITPINYILYNNQIYFHCAHTGRKLSNIAANSKVCFEVSQTDKSVVGQTACQYGTRFTSVLVFGGARVVEETEEKIAALMALTKQFAGDRDLEPISSKAASSCTVVAIRIESVTGKRNVDPQELNSN